MTPLSDFLNQALAQFHQAEFLSSDPLEFPHRFQDPWDQEAVALLASALAYGNVKQIRKSVDHALQKIQSFQLTPAQFVRRLSDSSTNPSGAQFHHQVSQTFSDFVHRFNSGRDVIGLLTLLSQSWKTHGSLGGHFLKTQKHQQDPDISAALGGLLRDWREQLGPQLTPSLAYFLSSPEQGSCCKRWCMFLRWMGRKDQVDLGLWMETSSLSATFPKGRALRSSQLVMPLDVHTARISQRLGLTHRKSMNWKAALEVTESLKRFNPHDPVQYDFALSRLGILDIYQDVENFRWPKRLAAKTR